MAVRSRDAEPVEATPLESLTTIGFAVPNETRNVTSSTASPSVSTLNSYSASGWRRRILVASDRWLVPSRTRLGASEKVHIGDVETRIFSCEWGIEMVRHGSDYSFRL